MDGSRPAAAPATDPAPEEQIAAVEERIAEHREQLAETIGALSYKTDVAARGSEALADGIDTAKQAAAQVAEDAAVGAIDATARVSEALGEGVAQAKKQAVLAADFAVATAESVEPETWRQFRWGAAALIFAIVAIAFVRRRSA